jgi:predicted nucleic-acid-binding protein
MEKQTLTAIDANILLRLLTNDPPALAEKAVEIIESRRCFISAVVLMEVFHVLESFYALKRPELVEKLDMISRVGLVFDRPKAIYAVIAWYRSGMDFGDAMTLAYAADADELLTFDAGFVKKAKKFMPPLP